MLELTDNTLRLIQNTNIVQQLAVEIDGMPLFASIPIERIWKIGDEVYIGDEGLTIGGTIPYPNQKAYISIAGNTTRTITQALDQNSSVGSSITTINIELVDKNFEITELFSSGFSGEEVLGKSAKVYLSFVGSRHPEDSIVLLSGILDTINFLSSSVQLSISHPMQLARQQIFMNKTSELDGGINDSVTTIPALSTDYFIVPTDDMESYIVINDEIIQYTGISGNDFTGCTRASLGSIADSHDDEDEISPLYRFVGNAFDIALKVLISTSGNSDALDLVSIGVNFLSFVNVQVGTEYSLVEGDKINISGSGFAGNNTTVTVSSYALEGAELKVYIDETLTLEPETTATCTIKSKYDILNSGAGLDGRYVDVQRFEELRDNFNFAIPDIDLFIDDSIEAKDFIEQKIFRPCGVYSVPRKGKISCSITLPPYSGSEITEFNATNVIDGSKIKMNRTINRNYYNHVNYRYKKDYLSGKYLRGELTQDSESLVDFGVGARVFTIDADCFRENATIFLQSQGLRTIERFKRGAETLKIKTNYKTGIPVEIGDIVVFDGSSLSVSDSKTGSKEFKPRLMEIINKSHSLSNGIIELELIDTAYDASGRFASISPSSTVDSGSTTTSVKLSLSNSAKNERLEGSKWEDFIGDTIRIHSADFSVTENAVIKSIDPTDESRVILESALSFTPASGYVVDLADYQYLSDTLKVRYVCFCRGDSVVSGSSATSFTVADGSLYYIGMRVRLYNSTFSSDSGLKKITNIVGNTITVENLGFTPDNTFNIHLGFVSDESQFYLYL